jgi:Na+/proline symporter
MSTSSGLLISIAGTVSYDVWGRGRRGVRLTLRRRRFRIVAMAGMAIPAVVALGVRGVDISILVGWAFALAASTFCPLFVLGIWWPRLTSRGAAIGIVAGGVVAIAGITGAGLAAVQLLPLYELGTFSFRGGGVSYEYASQYSFPPAQLLSLLLPAFFVVNGQYWGLWSHWEVFAYAGIAPLVLALAGVALGRHRLVVFFLVLALGSLALALGEHSPFGIHRTLAAPLGRPLFPAAAGQGQY